jgi:hypothetical protein
MGYFMYHLLLNTVRGIMCSVNNVNEQQILSLYRKRELIQVLGLLTGDIEQLVGIGREREKGIVKGEVEDTGTHWNMKEKESGTENESETEREIERGIGCGREKEEECLHHQQGDHRLGEGMGVMQYMF